MRTRFLPGLPLSRHVMAPLLGALLLATARSGAEEPLGDCGAAATPIHAVQGSGATSPLAGRAGVVVEGVVVASFGEFPGGLGGFFLQEEDADADGSPLTSEGIFVFDPRAAAEVAEGDTVRVRGAVREFFGLTELGDVADLRRCPARGVATPAAVRLPVADERDWERWEGMRVRSDGELVVSDVFDLGRFGEIALSAEGRLWQPTQRAAPGAAAIDWARRNARHRIALDDGRYALDPDPPAHFWNADGDPIRAGDRIAPLEGVLDFAFGRFRIHPTRALRFTAAEPRPTDPPSVDGALRIAVWNVANFFNGDGAGGGFPTRGAASSSELERQRAKIASALARLDAGVFALVELENDGVGPGSAARELADELASRIGAPVAIADPGERALGDHAIAVALLYRGDRVDAVGAPAVLDARAHPAFDSTRNRPALAQTFRDRATGELVTIAVNHWKSKGSSCETAGDPDAGDGQGECNRTRTRAAEALAAWLAGDPTRTGGAPALVVGDLNAYPNEDPVAALRAAGFADLLAELADPDDAYSYVFDGAAGRLDHALAGTSLRPHVGGAAVWHIDADEAPLLDYRAHRPPALYAPDPFRASDHDPLLVGLFPDADADGRTDARDACPHSALAATVVWNGCDTGVAERVDAEGCTVADRLSSAAAGDDSARAFASAAARWLARRAAERWITRRERVAILACVTGRRAGGGPGAR